MQRVEGRFIYSASDLNNFMECKRLSELNLLVAQGLHAPPPDDEDEQAKLVRRKGEEHERRYLDGLLTVHGNDVEVFQRPPSAIAEYEAAARATFDAMRAGKRIIYQGTFFDGQFVGHPDFLRKVEGVRSPGLDRAWSYEVLDTKLALSSKPYFIIQLCNYSEHLARVQGVMPANASIILGNGEEERFKLNDYLAYYRHLKKCFLESSGDAVTYPHENSHCSICIWSAACERKRVEDDYLGLVANIRRDQIAKLEKSAIRTVAQLAQSPDDKRPAGMPVETFAKLRAQAALQVRGRTQGPIYELLPHPPHLGFGLLPPADPGDLFFDMEGDPMFEPGRSLEYLFGFCDAQRQYTSFWGTTRAGEKRAFEQSIDFIMERRAQYPTMHVYHYANYEKAALRRLAQVHGTREDEVDVLLRAEVLVDLYAVVRPALMISEDSYSIKRLEKFYELRRETEVRKGDVSIVEFERWLLEHDQHILDDIEHYNRDDCYSTYLLREWLLQINPDIVHRRPRVFGPGNLPCIRNDDGTLTPTDTCHAQAADGCKRCAKRQADAREDARKTDLEQQLLKGTVAPQTEHEYRLMPADHRARYLLGNLLAYHRRERKPFWWNFFHQCENVDQLVEFDKEAIGGLTFCADVPVRREKNSSLYTYTFPDQHYKLGAGDQVRDPDTRDSCGTIFEVNEDENRLVLKWTGSDEQAAKIRALVKASPPDAGTQRAALAGLAESYHAGTLQSQHPATYDLLTSGNPRVIRELMPPTMCVDGRPGDAEVIQPREVTPASVSRIVQALDNSYLFVQGPPGTGKTTIGAHVIADLLHAGKRVGVMSTGHKAIHNLLHKVEAEVERRGDAFVGLYKYTGSNGGSEFVSELGAPFIASTKENADFETEDYDLAGGTSWLFARPELAATFDYLFIDEAGQVSLADALAVSACAKNVVLLGDPSQLAQVTQGSHPMHADDSVLQHVLGDDTTIPERRGVFLNVTYRMHPEICKFISESMYDGRLHPSPQTAFNAIDVERQPEFGLRYVAVMHQDNSSSSREEADAIVRRISVLLQGNVTHNGEVRPIGPDDIIVVTPYNAQRRVVLSQLRAAGIPVQVGTVDKFQGQQAFVVIYTTAASSGEDAPRGFDFIFDRNRFNVAVSRAKALSVYVGSPALLDSRCRTSRHMSMLSNLCLYCEAASEPDEPQRPEVTRT